MCIFRTNAVLIQVIFSLFYFNDQRKQMAYAKKNICK